MLISFRDTNLGFQKGIYWFSTRRLKKTGVTKSLTLYTHHTAYLVGPLIDWFSSGKAMFCTVAEGKH